MVDLASSLTRLFGHAAFRPGQRPVIEAVMAGADVLAVMPTGAGKSLGFQLPAALLSGVTLVVSPLIALMKDQVDDLNRRGIGATAIHSALDAAERQRAIDAARHGAARLLYVAPERFGSEAFLRWLPGLPVARFVVDEAHCVSEWGHDFRPDYRRLAAAAARCRRSDGAPGRPPIAAFTATATPEVRADIVALLGLAEARVFVAGFDRPNIELRVRPVAGEAEKRTLLPALVGDGVALVYAATRRKAEVAAETLQDAGIDAAAYHAGLADEERVRVQDAFAAGRTRVVCATNAFGMGIDRPDIAAVVHVDVPGSLAAYYQEIGRAGRDGRAAVATLLWNFADVKTREFLIERGREPEFGRPGPVVEPAELERRLELDRAKLRRMVAYADSSACLRATILRYFGDAAVREPCNACSSCARRARLSAPQLEIVRKILAGVARAGQRFGKRRIVAMLCGALDGLPAPLTQLSTTGILSGIEPRAVERWVDAASAGGLLASSDDEYRTLSLTPLGREVMAGRDSQVSIPVPADRPSRTAARRPRESRRQRQGRHNGDVRSEPSTDVAPAEPVRAALRAWRSSAARERGVKAYLILHDRTIDALATSLPRSPAELRHVPGIGDTKLADFGEAILAVVAAHAADGPRA